MNRGHHSDRLVRLRTELAGRPVESREHPSRQNAGVVLNLLANPDRLLVIRRAERPGDPWSGQLGLPGGRWQVGDRDLWETAARENREEVGFDPYSSHQPIRLPDLAPSTRVLPPTLVRPWLAVLDEEPRLTTNEEVAAASWVEFDELAAPGTHRPARIEVAGRLLAVEGYHLSAGLIWGMTERILRPVVEAWSKS